MQLSDTKASDRKMTLLHFIVKTVREKFPDVATFDTELKYVEKAATGRADFLPILCWLTILQVMRLIEKLITCIYVIVLYHYICIDLYCSVIGECHN